MGRRQEKSGEIDRRRMLQRLGLGAATAYVAPALLALGGDAQAGSVSSGRRRSNAPAPHGRRRSDSFSRPSRPERRRGELVIQRERIHAHHDTPRWLREILLGLR